MIPSSTLLNRVVSLFALVPGLNAQQVLPFFDDGVIAVDAAINGQKARFFYDTGASATALFAAGAARLKVETDAAETLGIAGHATEARRSVPVELEMFGKKANTRFLVLPFANPRDGVLSWRNVPGAMLIDGFDRRILAVTRLPEPAGWRRWALESGNSQLFLAVTENGRPVGRVFVDTGVSGGLRVSPKLWSEWVAAHPAKPRTLETFRYAVGETMVNEVAWAEEFRLGDLVFRNVDIGPIPSAKDGRALDKDGKEFAATVGLGALRHLRLIVSQETREVWTQEVGGIPAHNRLGAVFVARPESPGKLVCRVSPKTPAFEAGLRDGDVLEKIAGETAAPVEPAWQARMAALCAQPAGTVVVLEVRRKDVALRIEATLRDLLR